MSHVAIAAPGRKLHASGPQNRGSGNRHAPLMLTLLRSGPCNAYQGCPILSVILRRSSNGLRSRTVDLVDRTPLECPAMTRIVPPDGEFIRGAL